jgi:hypothetical protein
MFVSGSLGLERWCFVGEFIDEFIDESLYVPVDRKSWLESQTGLAPAFLLDCFVQDWE